MSLDVVDSCAVCPRLCRHACPVAEGTAREAAVPANLARIVRGWRAGLFDDALAAEAATLCVDCGACTDACHLHVPLPDALAAVRAERGVVPAPAPLRPIEGSGARVALHTDARAWSAALAERLGEPVAAWSTDDDLGWSGRGHPGWTVHLQRVRVHVGAREVITASQDAARVLAAAGVRVTSLAAALGLEHAAGCGAGPTGCCGGRGPLREHHPADAARMAARMAWSGPLADPACRHHLRACGRVEAHDVVDVLLGSA